jgi:hypothetical protein
MTRTETKLAHGDPFAPTQPGERRETYARLAEQAPVHRITLPDGEPVCLVTQNDAARHALADPRLVRRRPSDSMLYSGLPPDLEAAIRSSMLHLDPSTPGCANWCRRHSPSDRSRPRCAPTNLPTSMPALAQRRGNLGQPLEAVELSIDVRNKVVHPPRKIGER